MHSATHMFLPLFGDMLNSLSSRRQALKQEAVDLPFQFPGRPVVSDGLDLVERAGSCFLHA